MQGQEGELQSEGAMSYVTVRGRISFLLTTRI